MPGLSKVIVLDPDARASRQVQLGFEREGIPAAAISADAARLELPGEDTGLVVVGGADGAGAELVRRARGWLDDHGIDAPILFAGRGVAEEDVTTVGADEVVRQPAYLRDVVTIGKLLRGRPSGHRHHLVGNLIDVTGVFTLVRALAALGRSATLTLVRGLRRGEVRFYHGEVTSAHVGMIHGQAALHQLLLWTDARFDFHHEDVVRRHQIPLSRDELLVDAERFLAGVRDSSGGLSPAMVLEQNLPRVQAFAKQIPTEVYGVLRMFDGHHTVADVLEDSAYRVFETLRVAQRAVDAGLLRIVEQQPRRPSWRAILAIEEWLVGAEPRDAVIDSGPIATQSAPARESDPTTARDARGTQGTQGKSSRKRRRKKRRVEPPPPVAISAEASRDIDWGALIPRTVGAEVGPLAGVIPASQISGEIVAARAPARDPSGSASDSPEAARAAPGEPEGPGVRDEPTVVFDEVAERAEAERVAAKRLAVERAITERITVPAEARAAAERADTERISAERIAVEARADTERALAEQIAAEAGTSSERADTERMAAEQIAMEAGTSGERADTERMAAEQIAVEAGTSGEHAEAARAEAIRAETVAETVAETTSVSSEAGHVADDLQLEDTKPARGFTTAASRPAGSAETPAIASSQPAMLVGTAVVQDSAVVDASDAVTARLTAAEVAEAREAARRASMANVGEAEPEAAGPRAANIGEAAPEVMPGAPGFEAPSTASDSAPTLVADETSDGVILHHIATAETAPVRRRQPSEPPDNDRPGDATGEITMPMAQPSVVLRHSEPTILVADLASVHAAVSAVAGDQAAAPATPDAATASREAPVIEARGDATAFSDIEEAFFRAGHELHEQEAAVAAAPPVPESFDDLDADYRPVGFWERLRRKPSDPPARAPDEPEKK